MSWQFYVVLLFPGLGVYACGQRLLAALVWIALVAGIVLLPWKLCIGFAVLLQVLCLIYTARHGK